MNYITWFLDHDNKHRKIVDKLKQDGLSSGQIIDYFEFDNMLAKESDFCLLYAEGKKCHDIAYLNCYMCACPYFRFNDEGVPDGEGILVKSQCAIHSSKSDHFVFEGVAHLDCSRCTVPHTRTFIKNNFDERWQEMMKNCAPPEADAASHGSEDGPR